MDGEIRPPIDLGARRFRENKETYYRWLRENAPVCRGRFSVVRVHLVARYDDCVTVLRDPRFVRNRSTATGGRRTPIPLPPSLALLSQSMIIEDDPTHRRLRALVQKAFTPRALTRLEGRIEQLTQHLLDQAEKEGHVDLIQAYALPIPVTVISEMVGVDDADTPNFTNVMSALSKGLNGWRLARTLLLDLRRSVRFVRELIERKRRDPGDDILTGLIEAEEDGERLSENELVSMVFLLVIAGFETTVHLITNGVLALLQHPEQLERLRGDPSLMDTAVEEILRFAGPIHGTKPQYPTEDVTLRGVTLPKGATIMPLLGAANRDPEVFDDPETFDVARTPNRHLAFGFGPHYCLGAPLARMETRIALANLLERNPGLRLSVEPSELRLQPIPLWHRYERLPVALG